MKKAEAYKVLNIQPPAGRRQVEKAYWEQAHECRDDSEQKPNARERLLELNEAYSILTNRERLAPLELVEEQPQQQQREYQHEAQQNLWLVAWEGLVSWVRAFVKSTAARWPERGSEIAALTVCLLGLAILAIIHAAIPSTLLVLAAGLVIIRAPWRR